MYVVYPHNEGTTFCCMRYLGAICAQCFMFSGCWTVRAWGQGLTAPGLDILILRLSMKLIYNRDGVRRQGNTAAKQQFVIFISRGKNGKPFNWHIPRDQKPSDQDSAKLTNIHSSTLLCASSVQWKMSLDTLHLTWVSNDGIDTRCRKKYLDFLF